MKAHIQVHSRTESGIIGKLSYRDRGTFIITKNLGNSLFEIKRYGTTNTTPRKYKNLFTTPRTISL